MLQWAGCSGYLQTSGFSQPRPPNSTEQHSDTVFPCVFTSSAGSRWEDITHLVKRAAPAFQLRPWGLPPC